MGRNTTGPPRAAPGELRCTCDVRRQPVIADRSYRYASLCLWNEPPLSLRQPHS